MAGQFPESALSREQKPWGREVEGRIAQLEQALSRALGENTNANKGQNSTIDVVVAQIDDIQTAVAGAATAQSVADLAFSTRISPLVDTATASAFTLTTGGITVISRTINVPAGYTRALIFGAGYVNGLGAASGGDRITSIVRINGISGAQATAVSSTSQPWASVAPSNAQSLSGLSGSFPVTLEANIQVGPGGSSFTNGTLTIMVLFLP